MNAVDERLSREAWRLNITQCWISHYGSQTFSGASPTSIFLHLVADVTNAELYAGTHETFGRMDEAHKLRLRFEVFGRTVNRIGRCDSQTRKRPVAFSYPVRSGANTALSPSRIRPSATTHATPLIRKPSCNDAVTY